MICENIFCIYQEEKNNECCLENISLDVAGMCQDCIYINVDEKELQALKNKLLDKYNSDYDYN